MDDADAYTWVRIPKADPEQAVKIEPWPQGRLVPGDRGYREGVEDLEHEQWVMSGLTAEEWEAQQRGESAPNPPAPVASVDIPEIALTVSRKQAAALLGISPDTFREQVLPHLRVVQLERRQLIPVDELQRFVNERKAFALRGQR